MGLTGVFAVAEWLVDDQHGKYLTISRKVTYVTSALGFSVLSVLTSSRVCQTGTFSSAPLEGYNFRIVCLRGMCMYEYAAGHAPMDRINWYVGQVGEEQVVIVRCEGRVQNAV